jgi:hypothetical protein
METVNVLTRIKDFVDHQGLNISHFEKLMGFSNGSLASQIKAGKTIGVDKLERILIAFPSLSSEWLLRGIEPMIIDVQVKDLNLVYDKLRHPEKYIKAKRLYVLQHLSAAEVSRAVGVSANTMCKWVNDGDWKQEQLRDIGTTGISGYHISGSFIIDDLKAYLEDVSPFFFEQIKPVIENYQTLIKS